MDDRLGSLEVGRDADLVLLRRDRLFWPPNRYDHVDPLDVILDRADLHDIAAVLVRGETILDDGRIVTVDEPRIRDRHAEAGERRLWERDAARTRSDIELPTEVGPHALDFYRTWSDQPVVPGYIYNTSAQRHST